MEAGVVYPGQQSELQIRDSCPGLRGLYQVLNVTIDEYIDIGYLDSNLFLAFLDPDWPPSPAQSNPTRPTRLFPQVFRGPTIQLSVIKR